MRYACQVVSNMLRYFFEFDCAACRGSLGLNSIVAGSRNNRIGIGMHAGIGMYHAGVRIAGTHTHTVGVGKAV